MSPNIGIVGRDCKFEVKIGKVYCVVHRLFPKVVHEGKWTLEEHLGHNIVQRPMRHVCYETYQCETCNDGVVLMDSSQ